MNKIELKSLLEEIITDAYDTMTLVQIYEVFKAKTAELKAEAADHNETPFYEDDGQP